MREGEGERECCWDDSKGAIATWINPLRVKFEKLPLLLGQLVRQPIHSFFTVDSLGPKGKPSIRMWKCPYKLEK